MHILVSGFDLPGERHGDFVCGRVDANLAGEGDEFRCRQQRRDAGLGVSGWRGRDVRWVEGAGLIVRRHGVCVVT